MMTMKIARYLRAKGNAPCSMLSVLSLLLLGVGGMLLPVGEARAAYCDGDLQYSLSGIPSEEINVAGIRLGYQLPFIARLTHVAGLCKPGTQFGLILRFSNARPCTTINSSRQVLDSNGIIGFDGCYMDQMIAAQLVAPGAGWIAIPGSGWAAYLHKKVIGRTTVKVSELINPTGPWWSHTIENASRISSEPSGKIVGDINKTITLVYIPTCSASVNDVVFPGSPTASAIAAGTVTPQTATVNVSCNDILPKYTVKVSSPNGTQGNATDGVIKSNNASVGYRLSWKEGQVASVGSNIQLDSVLTPATQPTTNTFNVPISVKPVALVPLANVTAGPANSAIKIDLTFN